jgi:hypothetical protein
MAAAAFPVTQVHCSAFFLSRGGQAFSGLSGLNLFLQFGQPLLNGLYLAAQVNFLFF